MEDLEPTGLTQLIGLLLEAHPDSQPKLGSRINQTLRRMRSEGDVQANAEAVLEALSANRLTGYVDDDGRSCRAEAVETVLRAGHPVALRLSEEDLRHHRLQQTGRGPGALAIVGVLVAAYIWLTLASTTDTSAVPGFFVFAASILFLIVRWFQRSEWRKHERS